MRSDDSSIIQALDGLRWAVCGFVSAVMGTVLLQVWKRAPVYEVI
jgi:hypothetical protein